MSHRGFHAVEVFNGGAGFDVSDAQALEFWEDGIMQGESWVPIGASDCHRWETPAPGSTLDAALGWPRTYVARKGEESIEEALFAGRVIVSDPTTSLRYWMENPKGKKGPSERITGPATLHVHAETQEPNMWISVKNGQGNLLLHEELTETRIITLPLEAGVYWVRILPEEPGINIRGMAVGMPIWVD